MLSRAVVDHPPPASRVPPGVSGGGPQAGEAGIVALAVAMIVLEVVLLTGPAFAVGVRRQRRRLALVAAAGGDERHLRAIVLAGGGILGAIAAVGGAVLGIAVAAAAVPVLDRVSGTGLGPFDVPWVAVLATPATGLLSGLAAAYVPARRAARMDVAAALAGRRDAGRTPRGRPIAGGVLVVAGLVLSLAGARKWHEYGAVAGAVAIIVGCVLLAPWTVGAAARAARYLPLRLAVRDGARNRGRSAPVVAAIMAAVAGITVLAIGGASDFEQRRREYEPRLPSGAAVVRPPEGRADEVGRAVRAEVPGVPLVEVRTLPEEGGACPAVPAKPCPFVAFSAANADAREITAQNVVGGAQEARMLLGRDDPAVISALNAGKVVLFGVEPPADGTVTAKVAVWERDEEKPVRTVAGLPVAVLGGDSHVRAIVPPSVARRIGLPARTALFGVDRADHKVTKHEEGRIRDVVSRYSGSVYVERGFTESYGTVLLVLAVTGTVLALGGSLIATGLAAADARPDLATLAAIGARPRTRRLLAMGQAGFVAALGCWLGLAAGLVPGMAVARPLTMVDAGPDGGGGAAAAGHGPIIDVPWPLLGLIGIAVPLAAMLAAGLSTRARLPMARRLTA
ncbi:FtsX-like permease family protein [Actinomadura yumaensis]|uniref:FtsX-like permease family protein n=1 Tax=Actinomadura yumaensis TaxID=111807 RepID=UPI003614C0FC